MKDILVEFHDYGAIIHKDPSVIASKKDLPYCFFNPDLSKVEGVSPSFWKLDEFGRILKCADEEIQRRIKFYEEKRVSIRESGSNNNLFEEIREEFYNELEVLSEKINNYLEHLTSEKCKIDEYVYTIRNDIENNKKELEAHKQKLNVELEKQLKLFKLGIAVSFVFSIILKLL